MESKFYNFLDPSICVLLCPILSVDCVRPPRFRLGFLASSLLWSRMDSGFLRLNHTRPHGCIRIPCGKRKRIGKRGGTSRHREIIGNRRNSRERLLCRGDLRKAGWSGSYTGIRRGRGFDIEFDAAVVPVFGICKRRCLVSAQGWARERWGLMDRLWHRGEIMCAGHYRGAGRGSLILRSPRLQSAIDFGVLYSLIWSDTRPAHIDIVCWRILSGENCRRYAGEQVIWQVVVIIVGGDGCLEGICVWRCGTDGYYLAW